MSQSPGPALATAAGGFLQVRNSEGIEQRVPLAGTLLVIGRAADAQVVLQDTAVSRHHAQLTRDGAGHWALKDLGSRNGTLVNGKPITEQIVSADDRIQVGTFHLALCPAGMPPRGADLLHLQTSRSGMSLRVSSDEQSSRLSALSELESPRIAADHLLTLTSLAQRLLEMPDAAQRSSELCRMMASAPLCGRWAALLRLSKADGNEAQVLCDWQPEAGGEAVYVSRSLLRTVSERKEAVLARNLPASGLHAAVQNIELSISPSVVALAAIACPLRHDENSMDLLYVTLPPQYGSGEWLALASLAVRQYQQAEAAWEARKRAETRAALERELEKARSIQRRLVPQPRSLAVHRASGLDIAVGFVPSQWVGGDYVDVVTIGEGRVLLVVADVCGHGLAAALVASSLHTMIHAWGRGGMDLPTVVCGVNEYLCGTLPGDAFVTMAAALADGKRGEVQCVNAGHPPAMIARADGSVRRLPAGNNLPLGLAPLEAGEMSVDTERLAPGEWMILYTDGLTEQTDHAGQMLGIDGLAAQLQQIVAPPSKDSTLCSADAAVRKLNDFLDNRQGPAPGDDRAFLLVGAIRAE